MTALMGKTRAGASGPRAEETQRQWIQDRIADPTEQARLTGGPSSLVMDYNDVRTSQWLHDTLQLLPPHGPADHG